jgi:D-amino-acid dehydrogenase
VVLTPLGDRLRFGGTLELSGFRASPDARRYRAVVRGGLEALRSDVALADEESWYGFRPLTSDGMPVIGWAPGAEGVLVAAGHGMLGFTQAPITGKLTAQLANGERPSISLHAFRPDRFSGRRRILGSW